MYEGGTAKLAQGSGVASSVEGRKSERVLLDSWTRRTSSIQHIDAKPGIKKWAELTSVCK